MAPTPELHRFNPSLVRKPLLAGAEPGLVIVEVCGILGLLFLVGLHPVTIALAAFYGTVVHGFFVWLAAKDPQAAVLYLRSLRARDFYPATPRLRTPSRLVRPAIPEV